MSSLTPHVTVSLASLLAPWPFNNRSFRLLESFSHLKHLVRSTGNHHPSRTTASPSSLWPSRPWSERRRRPATSTKHWATSSGPLRRSPRLEACPVSLGRWSEAQTYPLPCMRQRARPGAPRELAGMQRTLSLLPQQALGATMPKASEGGRSCVVRGALW
ncbi:hypothetical protein BDV95DRAFT_61349 [Massariosphaeria phaeospora]|uniref:Uncharacterized protein n=1 Tax=Massariosphaeria phaeospora TaxID=100035 RepID=A0A7C8M8Q6_9PLEO|nr:hypothetical protein BDV95DRAFT_61349 [Massariosphaeria phaeospora]